MVCELPQKIKDAVERHKECYRTASLEGTPRQRRSGGFASYVQECEDAREALMRRAGVRHIGSGVHRDVYGFGTGREECVVKVARSDDRAAREANRNEWKAWRSAPRAAKEFLMPVTDADPDGWWLTMPLAGTPDTADYEPEEIEVTTRKMRETKRRTTGGGTARSAGGRSIWTTTAERTPGGHTEYTHRWTVGEEEDGLSAVGATLEQDLRDAGYWCSDVHGGNVGTYGGRNVIIDYGMGLTPRGTASCRVHQIRTPRLRSRTRPRTRPPLTLGRFA